MVGPWREARHNVTEAAEAILALMNISAPTQRQNIGAHLVGEFMIKAIHALPMPKR